MTPIKRNLLYIFRGTLLRLRITWNHGTALTLSVGYHVDKKGDKDRIKWTGDRCVSNTTHGEDKIPASVINRALESLESRIDKAFYVFENADRIPTARELKAALSEKNESSSEPLSKYFLEFLREGSEKKHWSDNTYRSVRNLLPVLQAFRKDLTLEDLSLKTLEDFVTFQTKHKISDKYQRKERPSWQKPVKFVEKGYTNSAILKNVRMLKWFLRWASDKGYIESNIEKSFSPDLKVIKKPVIFLNWEELMKVESLDLKDNPLWDQVRDFFCLCCFTSLRYSDAYNLKKVDVKETHLEVISKKTAANLIIDLNTHSKRILDKYKGSSSKYALPHLTLGVINYHLGEIMKKAGIDTPIKVTRLYGNRRIEKISPKYEFISSHVARKTFICNALSMGISPNVVMKWTGHTEYSAMKPYIDIADSIRAESMKLFDR